MRNGSFSRRVGDQAGVWGCAWLASQQPERGGPALFKSPLGQVIQYARNQWEALSPARLTPFCSPSPPRGAEAT